ncbi:MAG TPA: TonB-dependent receptor [Parafilimonas sp.]|nr:TonB-dependent receptor [Parafilimonas sp.]
MYKRNKLLFTICLLLIQPVVFCQSTLSGKITNNKNNAALAGASVYIPDIKLGAVSKADGSYEIKDIARGTYLIEVSFIGYAPQYKEINFQGNETADFNLEPSSVEYPEVVVTGVTAATEQRSNPAPVSFVTRNDLHELSYNNIIDALYYAPGVSEITEGPAISKPVIRGLGYNRVVTVNDGIRQEGQQFGDEFGIEIDPYTIDKVEILRGPASLSYGSDAMAGVINFLPAPTLPDGQIKGSILGTYQTNNGLYGGSANIAGNLNGITWDARYTYTDAHAYKNKYDGYVFNSGYGQNNFKTTIGINRNWGYSRITLSSFDLKLGIVEGGRDEVTGQFNRHVIASDGSDSVAIVTPDELKSYDHNLIIHQHVRHYKAVWDNSFVLGTGRLGVRLGFQQNLRQEANDATLGNVYNIYFHLNTFNYDVRYTLAEKKHFEFSAGANGMAQQSQNLGSVFLVPEYNLFDVGVFAIAKKTFDKLSISGGLRFDNRSLHGDDLYIDSTGGKLPGQSPDAIHRFTGYKTSFSGISGSIGLAYDFTNSFYGKLNVSRGFRAPNIAESGSDGIHDGTPFYEIGDPNLKPETSIEVDGTIGVTNKDITAEANLFVNNINNYIFPVKLASVFGGDSLRTDITVPDAPDAVTFKYISGDAVLSGGELTFNVHPQNVNWFHFNNTFSTVTAIQKHQGDSTKYLPYTPPDKLISGVEFTSKNAGKAFKNIYLRADVVHCFEQNKIYYKFGDETVTSAYTLLNIGAGADVCSKNKTIFSLYIYASNVTDVAYQSNMSRLKYTDPNNATGRIGVYEMGRNISFKLLVPIDFKN